MILRRCDACKTDITESAAFLEVSIVETRVDALGATEQDGLGIEADVCLACALVPSILRALIAKSYPAALEEWRGGKAGA